MDYEFEGRIRTQQYGKRVAKDEKGLSVGLWGRWRGRCQSTIQEQLVLSLIPDI